MRSLLWKEYHANLKWVVLPSLLLLVPMVLFGGPDEPPTGDHLLGWHLVAAGFGAVLGFLQVFFEARGDSRALLLHRPLSPSRIFLGKAVAGVGLYLLGMGLPFAALAVRCATPGHLAAPFPGRAVLPWVADVLTGVVYYFAGMLTAQREGRWYGGRCLGLPAAFLATLLVWTVPEVGHALLALAALGTLLGVAAWGSFLTGGAYAPQPRVARAALAGTLLAGLLVLSVAAQIAIGRCLDPGARSLYVLDRQGNVLLVRWTIGAGPLDSVTDLEGRVPLEFQGKRVSRSAIDEVETRLAPLSAWGYRTRCYRNTGRVFVEYGNETLAGDEQWFYVPEQGRLVGYDAKHRLPVGSYGPDGFVPHGERPKQRFPGELIQHTDLWDVRSPSCLAFPEGVYDVDFGRHTLQTLFTAPEGETVLAARRWKDPKQPPELLLVQTDRRVYVRTEAGAPLVSVPLAYDPRDYAVCVGRLEEPMRYVFWYTPPGFHQPEDFRALPIHVLEYDAAGREVASRAVPTRSPAEPSYAQALLGLGTSPAEAAALVGTARHLRVQARSSGGTDAWELLELLDLWLPYLIPGSSWWMGPKPGLVPGFLALSVVSAAACAAGCFWLGRRATFGRSRLVGWSLCGLAFGPAGLLLLLALGALPARVRCASCGRPRVVDRERCEHCGAPHAPPAPDGTEIFETGAAARDAVPAGR